MDVISPALRALELARLARTLPERPVVEGERGEPPLGERQGVVPRGLLFDRGKGSGRHDCRHRLLRRHVQHADEPVA
jgi:hypothetical protein